MLSRLAESLFWLGRYLERSEDLARILDVHIQDLNGAPLEKESAWTRDIKAILSMSEDMANTPTELIWRLTLNLSDSCSVSYALEQAWGNARFVRDLIPLELWEALNRTHFQLETWLADMEDFSPHTFLGWVKDRAAVASGIGASTMMRDEGWLFFSLGQALERADLALRLIEVKSSSLWPDPVVLLRCSSGHEAFLHAYRKPPTQSAAVLFLLRSNEFPRSVINSMRQIRTHLAKLSPIDSVSADLMGGLGDQSPVLAELGILASILEFSTDSDLVKGRAERLFKLQQSMHDVADLVTSKYFITVLGQRSYNKQVEY
ncbi:MAG: alpha-E domain-containing protein [Acidimicrobiaceae bacterium]|nr:alpha-E domain-containing protein [Acidimicrobiaceae bacterium]